MCFFFSGLLPIQKKIRPRLSRRYKTLPHGKTQARHRPALSEQSLRGGGRTQTWVDGYGRPSGRAALGDLLFLAGVDLHVFLGLNPSKFTRWWFQRIWKAMLFKLDHDPNFPALKKNKAMIWNKPHLLVPYYAFFVVHQNPLESSQTQNTLNTKLSTKTQRGTCFTERLFEQHHTGTFCSS